MRTAILLLLAALALPAQAASFDCAKASHAVEKLVCANPTLSKLDEDLAQAFKQRLALVLDKTALRGQQKDWNGVLRSRCAKGCPAAEIEQQYRDQIAALRGEWEEAWSDSYKTNEPALLELTVKDAGGFGFRILRSHVDEQEVALCRLPAEGAAPPLARLRDEKHARWSEAGCTLDFTLERDARGGVTAIGIASQGCERYCKDGRRTDGHYTSENNWVAGNQ